MKLWNDTKYWFNKFYIFSIIISLISTYIDWAVINTETFYDSMNLIGETGTAVLIFTTFLIRVFLIGGMVSLTFAIFHGRGEELE